MTQVVPTVLYPILQSTASHEAPDVQALHVPFSTGIVEQALHVLPLKYSPVEQVILSHLAPFALYPSLHDTAVQVPVDEQAVQVPLLTLMLEQAVQLLAPADDHVPEAQEVQDVAVPPAEYVPAEQLTQLLPFQYCPAEQSFMHDNLSAVIV